MKVSLFTLLPVLGLFSTALANPAAQPVEIVKRQESVVASGILADLINNVKTQTGGISMTSPFLLPRSRNSQTLPDSTLAALPSDADDAAKAAAQADVNSRVEQITALVNAATDQVKQLAPAGAKVRRQDVTIPTIIAQITALLLELSGTFNAIIAALGLTGLLSFLNPLTGGLSALLVALTLVIDGLLVAVGLLLNGLLLGLSVALAGIHL